MRTFVRLPLLLAVLATACGGDADSDLPATDPTADAAKPVVTGVTPADTLGAMAPMTCDDGLVLHATYWKGANPRVVLGTPDTVMVLAAVEAASGARYANLSPAIEWWNKGETATFTRGGRTTTCTEAAPGEVDF